MKRSVFIIFIAFSLLAVSVLPAVSQEIDKAALFRRPPSGEQVLADTLVARPVGIAACVVGLAGSIIALPFALISGSEDNLVQGLIMEPVNFTFTRPVGELDYEYY